MSTETDELLKLLEDGIEENDMTKRLMESAMSHSQNCDPYVKGLTEGLLASVRDYVSITGCSVDQGLAFVVDLGEDVMRCIIGTVAHEYDPTLESRMSEYEAAEGVEERVLH